MTEESATEVIRMSTSCASCELLITGLGACTEVGQKLRQILSCEAASLCSFSRIVNLAKARIPGVRPVEIVGIYCLSTEVIHQHGDLSPVVKGVSH